VKGVNYFPQAFLVWQHAYNGGHPGSKLKKSKLPVNPKGVTIKKIEGTQVPQAAISKMFGRIHGQEYDKNILNLENHKISALVPEIRIFRAKNSSYVPFYFPAAADYKLNGGSKLKLDGRSFSGGAVVIQNFSVTNTKRDAYSFRIKSITASLSIKVDNIARLFDDPPRGYAPLMELFTFTEKTPTAGALLSGAHPRVAVTLGYSVPPGELFTPQERRSLERSKILAILSYQTHDFKMETDGSATVNIQYNGFLEEVENEETYDALVPSSTKTTRAKRRQAEAKKDEASASRKPSSEEAAKLEEERVFAAKLRAQQEARIMMEKLQATEKLHSIEFNEDFFNKKTIEKPVATESTSKKKVTSIDEMVDFEKDFLSNNIYYFTFGDFLNVWMEKIIEDIEKTIKTLKALKPKPGDTKEKEKERDDIVRSITLLTTGYTVNKISTTPKGKEKKIKSPVSGNIADIPIAVDTFYTLFYEHTIKKSKRSMDLKYFLNTFCTELLNRSMDEFTAHKADIIEKVGFSITSHPGQRLNMKESSTIKIDDFPDPSRYLADHKRNTNYYIFHQTGTRQSAPAGNGNKSQDLQSGIYHIHTNKDKGMIKTISFSMKGPAGMKDWNTAREGHASAELRLPHNATVEMYANALFLPGSYVYIDPNRLGFGSPKDLNSAARRLGLGGYYVVGDITTTYTGTGEMSTTLNLTFDAFPSNSSQPSMPDSRKKAMKDLRSLREG